MKKPEPKKYLNAIKAYKGGLSKIEGVDKILNYLQMKILLDQALMQLQSMRKFQMI